MRGAPAGPECSRGSSDQLRATLFFGWFERPTQLSIFKVLEVQCHGQLGLFGKSKLEPWEGLLSRLLVAADEAPTGRCKYKSRDQASRVASSSRRTRDDPLDLTEATPDGENRRGRQVPMRRMVPWLLPTAGRRL